MHDTGCHIHFPDSNRGATNEKSNQVCDTTCTDFYVWHFTVLLYLISPAEVINFFKIDFINLWQRDAFLLAGFNCWSTLRCGKCPAADQGNFIIFMLYCVSKMLL